MVSVVVGFYDGNLTSTWELATHTPKTRRVGFERQPIAELSQKIFLSETFALRQRCITSNVLSHLYHGCGGQDLTLLGA